MNRGKKIVIFWLPVIIWVVVIFQFSSRPVPSASEFYLKDFLIKKTAHIIEFGIFFVLIYRALRNTFKIPLLKNAIISLFLLILYAIADEYHQTFVLGRTGKLHDVLIDMGGGLLAWWALWKLLPKAPKKLINWAKTLQII